MRRLGWVASIARRGLVARRVLTAGSLLLTVIAVASAVVGPIYQRAAAQSFMVTKLASELDVFTGTSFVYQPAADTAPARALRHATHQADDVMGTGYLPAHGILEARTPTLPIWTPEGAIITFDSVEGQCEHVLLRGRCPTRAGEAGSLPTDWASPIAGARWCTGRASRWPAARRSGCSAPTAPARPRSSI